MPEIDTKRYIQRLTESEPLREKTIISAIHRLRLPQGSRGLDVGSGIGGPALLLAEAVGPRGEVVGLDLNNDFVEYAGERARERARERGVPRWLSFREGDMNQLPFGDDSFDWAWSMDCVGYHPMDPMPALEEMKRVVKPEGRIAILGWSSERLLPGYPLLEACLNATPVGMAPFQASRGPNSHFLRTLERFRELGLEELQATTLVGDIHAPFEDWLRCSLEGLFEMRWSGVEEDLSGQDLAEYRRLCYLESPDFILDLPDYYAFFTYSMFTGRVV